MRFNIGRLFLITLVFAILFLFLRRPILVLFDGSDPKFAHAVLDPWKHWLWLLGSEVTYNQGRQEYIMVSFISICVSVVTHFVGVVVAIGVLAWAWDVTTVVAEMEEEFEEDYQI
jgi:small-conductance mechanosensitive channel